MATDVSSMKQRETAIPGSPSKSGSKDADAEISLLELLTVLAERKQLILRIAAAFTLIGIILSLVLPKRYTATVTLLPPQQNSSMSSMLASQIGSLGSLAGLAGGSLGLKNPNEMYVGMLRSRTVEDAMVRDFELMREYREKLPSDARKTFEHRATIDGNSKDGLIRISVEDSNPDRAAQLANGYVDHFRKLSEHLAISEASQRRLFFEQQLVQAKNDLANAEEALKKTQQTTGLIEVTGQARALIESAAALRAEIAANEVEIKSLQTFATAENSQLIRAQQELDGLRAQLSKLGGSEAGSDASLIVPKGKVPEASLEYIRRLRDVKYNETIFEILARQFEMAKLDEAKQGALIQVVDAAIPPDKRSFPQRTLIVICAVLTGLLIGVFVAFLQSGLQNLKNDPESDQKLRDLRRALEFRTRAS
jgi:uncharacterized protein involved in exopolysaccharide biosynthesis